MNLKKWDSLYEARNGQQYDLFCGSTDDCFAILQLKYVDETLDVRYFRYEEWEHRKRKPVFDMYEITWVGQLPSDMEDPLEDLFLMFNTNRPEGFTGHSMSVSDIILLKQSGKISCWFVDTVGFREIDVSQFLPKVVPVPEEMSDWFRENHQEN